MTIWLVGHGVVGRRIERLCANDRVVVHDPRREPTPLATDGDVAVLAHPVRHAPLAAAFAARGCSVVTVGDHLQDTYDLVELGSEFAARGASLVIGAAVTPGLSGLLARWLSTRFATVEEIHVAVHGTAGPACARVHHRSLSGTALSWVDGAWDESPGGSGRELCWFPEPVGAHDCYRAEIASPVLLHQSFPDAARITARRSATRRDRGTARLPMLRPPHAEGGVGALRVEVRGVDSDGSRATRIVGMAELLGTATAATAAAFVGAVVAGEVPPGVVLAGDADVNTVAVLRRVEANGVRVQEFVGAS